MVKWYIRKRDPVRALQWTGKNVDEMIEFINKNLRICYIWGQITTVQIKDAYNNTIDVSINDYIIEGNRGTNSRFFVMEPKRFESIYEEYKGVL